MVSLKRTMVQSRAPETAGSMQLGGRLAVRSQKTKSIGGRVAIRSQKEPCAWPLVCLYRAGREHLSSVSASAGASSEKPCEGALWVGTGVHAKGFIHLFRVYSTPHGKNRVYTGLSVFRSPGKSFMFGGLCANPTNKPQKDPKS